MIEKLTARQWFGISDTIKHLPFCIYLSSSRSIQVLRKRRENVDKSKTMSTAAKSRTAIKKHENSKLKKHNTKKNVLQSAKSRRTIPFETIIDNDEEVTERKESELLLSPTMASNDAGNNGQTKTVQMKLEEASDIAIVYDNDDDYRDDKHVKYVQEEGDWGDFQFDANEAAFVRLVECVRKYALEYRLSNDSTLWPWYRKFRHSNYLTFYDLLLTVHVPSPSTFHANAQYNDAKVYNDLMVKYDLYRQVCDCQD